MSSSLKTQVIESVAQMRSVRQAWSRLDESPTIGFVPTMGALHAGHMALVDRARRENRFVVVSLFVNPTQFNNPEDLTHYPRPLEQDLQLLRDAEVDAVFLPQTQEIYADAYRFELREKELSEVLCGPGRPGHFAGVLTVVLKLFNLVGPTRAYFGEKDYQQLRLIQDMAKAFFLPVEVVPCPTVRESDGLAMSSRNLRLTPQERTLAPEIHRALTQFSDLREAREHLTRLGFSVEYLEEHWGRRFVAARLGSVRLIDNVQI